MSRARWVHLLCRLAFFGLWLYFTVFLTAGELARWSAGQPSKADGLSLVKGPDADFRITRAGNQVVAVITPVTDYYPRANFIVRVDKPIKGRVWFTVDYLDRGYNLVQVSGPVVRERWGIARLNTGKIRTA